MPDKILIIGSAGQLGSTFQSLTTDVEFIFAPAIRDTGFGSLYRLVQRTDAGTVINCAAWTDVRGAELPGNEEKVQELNSALPGSLAQICKASGKKFVTFSTDYVFNGKKGSPYIEADETGPLNRYGRSKLSGENLVTRLNPAALVIRTAGLYSPYGKNFIKGIADQVKLGAPFTVTDILTTCITDAESLARVTLRAIERDLQGVYHFANSSPLSWYAIALKVAEYYHREDLISPGNTPDSVKRPGDSSLSSARILAATGYRNSVDWQKKIIEILT